MKFGKTGRLLAMLGVTAGFFLVELIVGYVTHSMALIADSFHMLSDVLALLVAFLSVRISKRTSTKNTFGWARAEVLGALVNSVFLMALCFSIFVEALDRFTKQEEVGQPQLVLIVGCVGLAVNLFGLLIFHQHSHGGGGDAHAGHGHDHGHGHKEKKSKTEKGKKAVSDSAKQEEVLLTENATASVGLNDTAVGHAALPEPRIASSSQLNMRGVFLHVLGDALGSVVVIISALIIWLTDWQYKIYVDPAMSILLVCIISYTTMPLLRESALILMQTVPTHIEIDDIKKRLLDIEGVHAVHELHIWQLAGDRIIASAHIRCHNLQEYMRVAGKIKQFFHDVGIHSTTMQPEFEEAAPLGVGGPGGEEEFKVKEMENCMISCPPSVKNCAESVCCRPLNGKVTVVVGEEGVRGVVEGARGVEGGRGLEENVQRLERVLTVTEPLPPPAYSPKPPTD